MLITYKHVYRLWCFMFRRAWAMHAEQGTITSIVCLLVYQLTFPPLTVEQGNSGKYPLPSKRRKLLFECNLLLKFALKRNILRNIKI